VASPSSDGHFLRLLEVLGPAGGIMFVAEGYFDESGDFDESPGIFCVSGYYIATEAAKEMDRAWKAVLDEYGIAYFHMVDCAHGNEFYADMSLNDRIELVKKLIALVKKYTLEGFSIVAKSDTYQALQGAPDVYSDCAHACALAVQNFLHLNRAEGNIAYFFEQGHKNRTNAYSYVARTIKRPNDSLTFASKEGVRLLQAADLLAWQTTKYAKDYFYDRYAGKEPKRTPRKDFLSLMEHHHVFCYMGMGSTEGMGTELWPMSKRSPNTSNMQVRDAGPFAYLTDDDDKSILILPVLKPIGWRGGGGQMAYLSFEGLAGKQFALALDEAPLAETISFMMRASSLFEGGKYAPGAAVDAIAIERGDGFSLLRLQLRDCGQFALTVPSSLLDALKKALNES
jgi:hypothetical protein